MTEERKCYRKDCPGFETTALCKIGSSIVFDVCILDYNKSRPIKIENLPKILANPLDKKNDLQLLGIIDYKTPAIPTRRSRTKILNTLGHYTAIVQRTDNC